jgi:hypothetical protein
VPFSPDPDSPSGGDLLKRESEAGLFDFGPFSFQKMSVLIEPWRKEDNTIHPPLFMGNTNPCVRSKVVIFSFSRYA